MTKTPKEPKNSVCEAPTSWRELADRLIKQLNGLKGTYPSKPSRLLQTARQWIDSDDEKPLAYQLTEGLVWGSEHANHSDKFIFWINSTAWAINNIAAYELGFEDYEIALDILNICNRDLPKKQRLATLTAPEETDIEEETT